MSLLILFSAYAQAALYEDFLVFKIQNEAVFQSDLKRMGEFFDSYLEAHPETSIVQIQNLPKILKETKQNRETNFHPSFFNGQEGKQFLKAMITLKKIETVFMIKFQGTSLDQKALWEKIEEFMKTRLVTKAVQNENAGLGETWEEFLKNIEEKNKVILFKF